ncbi:aquaporin family protein [Nocardioidaceae bacterium]|nr:aquaporin family protein [Nocardioidaceae bacterium]
MLLDIFVPELAGTAMLLLLGCGVVANVATAKTAGSGADFTLIAFGWGLAVFAGVYVAFASGAHINPAVTIGLLSTGSSDFGWAEAPVYISAQLIGAFLGASLAYAAYKHQLDDLEVEAAAKKDVFCTAPAVRSYGWNVVTELIGTFVLVFVIVAFGKTPSGLGPLAVALLVVGIGASLGGPTGYAINPARDLGPRIAHALLPIRGKGGSDWAYSWVPIVGPLLGGALGGVAANLMNYV